MLGCLVTWLVCLVAWLLGCMDLGYLVMFGYLVTWLLGYLVT